MSASPPPYVPQGYPVRQPVVRAPDGTDTNTAWIWLFVALPVVEMLAAIPLLLNVADLYTRMFSAIDISRSGPSNAAAQEMLSMSVGIFGPVIWVTLIGYLLSAIGVLLGWLDWRQLQRRGVPKPFHWAWGFFTFAGGGTLVYLIGRSIVVRRRTDQGLAPLWTGIAVYILIMIATIVWTIYLVSTVLSAIKLN